MRLYGFKHALDYFLVLSTPITLFVVPTLVVAIRGRDYVPTKRQA